ncbi:30S ribosomal protein S18 [Patescibacteria group bacterium]|nr:30S ribosomal protein S18 [Patescibacteria group bacterium]MBU4162406.1 30S ribosomal protein S18 [Patescibacteria group bacterium]
MNCFFCKQNIKEIDIKKTDQLKKFLTGLGKIRSKERTGLCSYHQRKMAKAVKQSRHLGLLSATKK